jgi:hypothetical protein
MKITLSPHSAVPSPGTPAGDQARDRFLSGLIDILGDARFIWLPKITDTTTSTDESRHGVTITYDATVASRISVQGSGVYVDWDGDNDEADTPDVDNHSFGDGVIDEAFSIVVLANPDSDASAQSFISKQNSASVDEWGFGLTGTNSYPRLTLIDASSSYTIAREDQTGISASSDTLLVATYDGSADEAGIRLYKDGTRVDDASAGSTPLSYAAMENGASQVRLGCVYGSASFYNGKLGLACLTGKELNIDDVDVLGKLVNAFFDLAL